MARVSLLAATEVVIFQDHLNDAYASHSPESPNDDHNYTNPSPAVLAELDIDRVQNRQASVITGGPDSLALRLDQFHITSPQNVEAASTADAAAKTPLLDELANQAQIDDSGFAEDQPRRSLTPTTRGVVESASWSKHETGDFDYIVSVPASSSTAAQYYHDSDRTPGSYNSTDDEGSDRLYFGCNLLATDALPEGDDDNTMETMSTKDTPTRASRTVTLVATPINGPELIAVADSSAKDCDAVSSETRISAQSPFGGGERTPDRREPHKDGQGLKTASPRTGLKASPRTERIEDSFEAIDEFAEQLEALDEIIRLERILSPDKAPETGAFQSMAVNRSASTRKRTTGAARDAAPATELSRTKSLGRAGAAAAKNATAASEQQKKPGGTPAGSKRQVARPASLLPPKPPAKSSKPVTRPTFELPGEAVARRLKEQREARLSRDAGATDGAKPQPDTPQRKRSTRAPTRPTFELPGEAISRRKREEHQAKLRAQEEEERKRREFKARPIRHSVAAPNSYPRETATSRARQTSKAANASETSSSPAKKRLTIVGASPASRRTMACGSGEGSGSEQLRGREAAAMSDERTRGVSTSTGSTNVSKGSGGVGSSSVSAEELQLQRRRGREIFKRDNSTTVERGSEQREREHKAKLARQEAAERSRQLSREWAERRHSKRISSMMPSASAPLMVGASSTAIR